MDGSLWEHRYIIIIFSVIALYYVFEWQRAKATLYALMLQAKRYAKDMVFRSGKEQEDWVIKKAMVFLPFTIKIVMNENVLRAVVHELYQDLKESIDYGRD